jgi:hypothetical protein
MEQIASTAACGQDATSVARMRRIGTCQGPPAFTSHDGASDCLLHHCAAADSSCQSTGAICILLRRSTGPQTVRISRAAIASRHVLRFVRHGLDLGHRCACRRRSIGVGRSSVLEDLLFESIVQERHPATYRIWSEGVQTDHPVRVSTETVQSIAKTLVAKALARQFIPLLAACLATSWLALHRSGVFEETLPVRYVASTPAAKLDCLFHVPLITVHEGVVGLKIAQMAALQVRYLL